MIDFGKINSVESGQRDSFESLIRVLANREPPKKAKSFQPNDGTGGDGVSKLCGFVPMATRSVINPSSSRHWVTGNGNRWTSLLPKPSRHTLNLREKLMRVGNGPLHKHWFSSDLLDEAWFARQVKSAALKLDDRLIPRIMSKYPLNPCL